MQLPLKFSVFIWFSFIYRTVSCDFTVHSSKNDIDRGSRSHPGRVENELSLEQQKQLLQVLEELPPDRKRQLFDEFQKQRRDFERSRNKWSRLRDTLPQPDELLPVNQDEVDSVRLKIRSGPVPVVRDKRTLKFLIKELAEILGLRWTLLKYSLVVPLINNIVAPPNASAAPRPPPAAPSVPGKPASSSPPVRLPPKRPPPPRRLPPPKQSPPPPPPSPKQPQPASPRAPQPPATPARPVRPAGPPTIPPNQIDPNTIRYPFRPAPTIPILNFAPLPPGVTVPYPILFQWLAASPAAAPAAPNPTPTKGLPQQPPCAAPPPVVIPKLPPPAISPKGPTPPSRLPLPKPRPPVPPRPKPVPPATNAGPGKTPLKLEYDHPVRIEIFNNVKPYLPVSGTVYSGSPTLASVEEEGPTAHFENPTEAVVQAINEHYNTESNEENRDYDYGFYTPSNLNIESDVMTTPQRVVDYYDNYQNYDETTTARYNQYDKNNENHNDIATTINDNNDYYQNYEPTTNRYNNYYDANEFNNDREETTTNKYNEGFVSNVFHDDYLEQAEEDRAHINIKVSNLGENKVNARGRIKKRVRKPKKSVGSESESTVRHRWGNQSTRIIPQEHKVEGTPVSVFSTTQERGIARKPTSKIKFSATDEFPQNLSRSQKRRKSKARFENILPTSNDKLSYETSNGSSGKSSMTISRPPDPKKPSNEFRIIVPHARRRRDIFFDDAFKNFNTSFISFNQKVLSTDDYPTSTQSMFLDLHGNGQLSPNEEYRKKLEKDVEKYVEQYVEQQISQGVVDPNKPKTTVIQLKTNTGPPIKTITTTLSKQIDGDKSLLESVLEYSREINPVSNIGELGAEGNGVVPTEPSEVSQAFLNDPFKDSFKWDFGK